MARGLDENLPIKKTDIIDGNIPYLLIDEYYGVACDNYNEILVKKTKARRTNKEDPNNIFIEEYTKWIDISYYKDLNGALNGYVLRKDRETRMALTEPADLKYLVTEHKKVIDNLCKLFPKY